MRPQPTTPIFRRDIQHGVPPRVVSAETITPFDPVPLDPYPIPPNTTGWAVIPDPRAIARYGSYHVVVTSGGNPTPNSRVYVADFLTDTTDPTIAGFLDSNPAPAHSGAGMFPTDLLVKGHLAYIANEVWGGLWTVDLSNPAAPTNYIPPGIPQGTSGLPFIGSDTMFRAEWHPDNRYVVYSDRLNNAVRILDTQTGIRVGNVGTGSAPTSMAVWNGYAAFRIAGSTGGGFEINQLRIYDIDPPGSMALVGTLQGTGTEFTPGASAGSIVYDYDLLYITNRIGSIDFGVPTQSGVHLSVVNVSNPAAPTFVARRAFTSSVTSLSPGQLIKVGDLLYSADANQHGYVIDVSDPSNPTLVGDSTVQPFTTSAADQHLLWEPTIGYFLNCDEAFDRVSYVAPSDFL